MKFVTVHQGTLHVQSAAQSVAGPEAGDLTWDVWTNGAGLAKRAIHELLFDADRGHPPPLFPATVLARGSLNAAKNKDDARALIWIDPAKTVYPPALAAAGITLADLYLVFPKPADVLSVAAECLRCASVRAVVTTLPLKPTRVDVRRLQLAAEQGGGMGIFLRTLGRGSDIYAAASRWRIAPARGERTIQRWNIQLLHGQGRLVGQSIFLEKSRGTSQVQLVETNTVRSPAALVDQPAVSKAS